MAQINFEDGDGGGTPVTYEVPLPAPAPAPAPVNTGLPTWLQNIIAPIQQQPAALTNRLLPAPPRYVQPYEPLTQMQPPTLPAYQQLPTPPRSYQQAKPQPEATKYPGGWQGFTPQNQGYATSQPTPQQGAPLFPAVAQVLTQPAPAGSGMTPEDMEANLLVPQGWAAQERIRQAQANARPTGNTGTRAAQRAQFGAELPVGEGWSPQRIASATQTELRQFYSLDPRERYWLARAIATDNPRLYGRSSMSGQPAAASGAPVTPGYGYDSRSGYYNVPYNVQYPGGGGGGGGSYQKPPPEWYLNMLSWRI